MIYRIQEKFYGQCVSREAERLMEKAVEGDKLLHAPADDVRSSRRKLVRNWKGKDYEVFVVNDSLVEYEGRKYKFLAAARSGDTVRPRADRGAGRPDRLETNRPSRLGQEMHRRIVQRFAVNMPRITSPPPSM